jgi:type IV secretion system protein VirB5
MISRSHQEKIMCIRILACLAFFVLVSVAAPVRAQWAVVDTPAIAQLVQQVRTLDEAVQTARDQLAQARQTLKTMTGDRGMQLLLRGTPRNYLPTTWAELSGVAQGGGAFPLMSADARRAIDAMAVLTPQQLSALSVEGRQSIVSARQTNAVQLALAQEALATTSGRFAAIQSLIAAIPAAGDQKAILDLQARISAELGMLQNEQTKLQILHQATEAQASVDRQRDWEHAVAGQGEFTTRFRPVPQR